MSERPGNTGNWQTDIGELEAALEKAEAEHLKDLKTIMALTNDGVVTGYVIRRLRVLEKNE